MPGDSATVVRRAVRVSGVVQGVGFRPYVHALATSLGLAGHVGNDAAGVFVEAEGPSEAVEAFIERLPREAPPLARVDAVGVEPREPLGEQGFSIAPSRAAAAGEVTVIPPDTASCAACLAEVADPADRRFRYPFTACTYCGPRFTITTGLPYDRPQTTMAGFPLCSLCAREYEDPADRRFHAQPTACPDCGPRLAWSDPANLETRATGDAALAAAMRALAAGRIVAVKGVGGYHLMCDARQPEAVARLRARKARGRKPFAVLVRDLETARSLAALSKGAVALLASPAAPIVLAPVAGGAAAQAVSAAVAPGQRHVGVLLPYSPLHHLLFAPHPLALEVALDALVATSGNLADEPICTDPAEAEQRLAGVADAWLHHDRPIHVACDDSVVRDAGGRMLPVRRSRGYAPLPVGLPLGAPGVLAVGGELKTTLCLAEGRRAWLSQHLGDTGALETLALRERTADSLQAWTRVEPSVVAADAHPAYLSARWARELAAQTGARFATVQHHHAHLASLLAEHGVAPAEPVLGFAFDGTGFGPDGTIWGGELLLGSYASVERVGHLKSVRLPGGDAAIRRPARAALAHLEAAGIAWEATVASVVAAEADELRVVARMLATGAGCTPTTSMGRLFDAVASLLGVCHDAAYEGQAAMELEALASAAPPDPDDARVWAWAMTGEAHEEDPLVLDPAGSLAAAVGAVRAGARPAYAARAFHEAVADAVLAAALAVRAVRAVGVVGLTGGVFQNALLTVGCAGRLEAHGFTVLTHHVVPPNDGGLALGQAAVVAGGGG